MNLFKKLDEHLMRRSPLSTQRLPTFYPSAASCRNQEEGKSNDIIGSCIRAQYYRCSGYGATNPSGVYSQYIFAAGNSWEDYVCEMLKEMGYWVANTIKFQDLDRYISGELDILIHDPDIDENVIVEMKTYSSANYQAKVELVGNKKQKPKPKDQNLLQAFLYLGQFHDQGINRTYLLYFDRACGGPENNKQFVITRHEENGEIYPKISTEDADGFPYSYVDYRITLSGIYGRYAELMDTLKAGQLPPPDYLIKYPDEMVVAKFNSEDIAKTKYEKWVKDKNANPIGDWQCAYCDYRDLCRVHQEEAQVAAESPVKMVKKK